MQYYSYLGCPLSDFDIKKVSFTDKIFSNLKSKTPHFTPKQNTDVRSVEFDENHVNKTYFH